MFVFMTISGAKLFRRLMVKGLRSLSLCFMIVFCLFSSCVVRKGIQSFFPGTALESLDFGKTASPLTANPSSLSRIPSVNTVTDCKSAGEKSETMISFSHDGVYKSSVISLLFFILPSFLYSLRLWTKDRYDLLQPYSRMKWPDIPLFLRNRLLLI